MLKIAIFLVFGVVLTVFSATTSLAQKRSLPPRAIKFVIETTGERFVVATSNKTIISKARKELSLPRDQRTLFFSGAIAEGNSGHNQPWSWHAVPNNWDLVEISMELCDGRPSGVESNLKLWLRIGRFCPWASRVVAELPRFSR
jgi:hypothetical protein